MKRLTLFGLVAVVIGYVALGVLYAVFTPPWQAPDEPAHFNYVAQVASDGCCPIIAAGDYDFDYLEDLKSTQFPDDTDITPIEYEDHQPPLYYLLGVPVYMVSGGTLTAQRIFSVIVGAGVIATAYLIVLQIFPHQPTVALASSMLVAFIPQHIAIHASVNNDSLAELTLALVILVSIIYLQKQTPSLRFAIVLGTLVGLAFLTKLTVYLPAVLVVVAVVVLKARSEGHSLMWFLQHGTAAAITSLVIGFFWWVRNLIVYGFPDLTGLAAHDVVVTGQPTTAELIVAQGAGPYFASFFRTLFNSFWGQFGWMGVPMPQRVYQIILLFLALALIGGVLRIVRHDDKLQSMQRQSISVLLVVIGATGFGLLVYNVTFAQAQGRYLYPALIPLALFVTLGFAGWGMLIKPRLPKQLQPMADWLPVLAMAWLPLLSLYALFRFIVPNLG